MIFITILNSLAILLIFIKLEIINVSRDETFCNKTLLGYDIYINKLHFRLPIRNKQKTELKEEVHRMIYEYNHSRKLQTLSAKFSWLKTYDEVIQFEKDYTVVDRKIVEKLVYNFKNKQILKQ